MEESLKVAQGISDFGFMVIVCLFQVVQVYH